MFIRIEVNTGASDAVYRTQFAVACVAAVTLAGSGLDPAWLALALCALAAVAMTAHHATRRLHPPGRAILGDDGCLRSEDALATRQGVLAGTSWVSRWCCVFDWHDGLGRTRRSLVMASTNRADDYRRLRVVLRLRAVGDRA